MRLMYNIPIRRDLTGKKYNFLSVICREKNNKMGTWFRCRCDCGNEVVVHSYKISSGHTKSCGCLHIKNCKDMAIKRNKKMVGKNHPRWRDDLTADERAAQTENRCGIDPKRLRWKDKVYKRDNYTCQRCDLSISGTLCAHHIYAWNKYKKLRYVANNGITLCKTCHTTFHSKYGFGKNTRKQLTEWMKP